LIPDASASAKTPFLPSAPPEWQGQPGFNEGRMKDLTVEDQRLTVKG
jgi:hypothetical protein